MPGTVQAIDASCLILASKDDSKEARVVEIILPIFQMKKMGLREVRKLVQGCTARNQHSQLGNSLLRLPAD